MRTLFLAIFWPAFLMFFSPSAQAMSSYVELGTGFGSLSGTSSFFGVTNTTSNLGFAGSVSFYAPISLVKGISSLAFGIQNRMYFVSTSSPDHTLAMLSPNIAARFELSRFYGGVGFAPLALGGIDGPMSLTPKPGISGLFFEGGAVWRVVPELQIAASFALERQASSRLSGTEYGLRFRFPINPYTSTGDASSKFDGFRYPFGIMK